jgi:hypothetical protein
MPTCEKNAEQQFQQVYFAGAKTSILEKKHIRIINERKDAALK